MEWSFVTTPHLAEGYICIHDKIMLCGCRQLVCRGIRLWIQGSAAPYVITEIVFPAHLQVSIHHIDHHTIFQDMPA